MNKLAKSLKEYVNVRDIEGNREILIGCVFSISTLDKYKPFVKLSSQGLYK